ncbi:chromosome associated protein G [Arctopsyche grandis]|uniref:chromosome associated protein G n=1 Tax=Arctopsyche grandis TaxID=121162 RepID=UPI00406D78F4
MGESICEASVISTGGEGALEGAPLLRNVPEIFQVFHNVQFNTVHHRNYVKELKKLYRKLDEVAFRQSVMSALQYTFTFGDANGNVDRVLQFFANFCASLGDEEDFLHFVFQTIFDCTAVAGHNVRNRSCQLLGLILTALGEDASLDDDICDKILSTQLERLQDVKGAVRCRAVLTLQRLQNPTDEDDPVTRAYVYHMSCDTSAAVRRAVVLSLAKSSRNLLHILERLCDVDESVRKAAFLYVSSINVTQLKVRQRVHILKVGLTERSPRVRQAVETTLIPTWLGAYKGSILDLLAAIRLDNFQGAKDSAMVAGSLLQSLFSHKSMLELLEWLPIDTKMKLIPAEHLSKESAWYWRHLVRHLHAIEDTDNLEQTLPELITFTGYVRALLESDCSSIAEQQEYSKRQCVLQELINIFPVYDMADEVGRVALQTLLYDSLTGDVGALDAEVIRAIMRSIDLVLPDVTNRVEFISGIISEIQEPAEEVQMPVTVAAQESNETKMRRARLRVSLNEALECQESAVHAQDFALAASCKEKVDTIRSELEILNENLKEIQIQEQPVEVIKEKRTDPDTLNKCLLIINMLLDSPQITKLTPTLRSLFENFEVSIFKDVEIRDNALVTVSLYSMLDEDFAKEYKAFFFTQFMDMNNEDLLVIALKCVIDIMCIHGVEIFNENRADRTEDKSVNKSAKRKSNTFKKRKSQSSYSSNSIESDSDISDDEDKQIYTPSTHDTIIKLFLKFMNSECVQYREVVVEGFCRLLMAGRLSSSKLVSHLLLLWFNPATEEEDVVKQLLGTFFPLFASHVEDAQRQLEAAFIPTLTTLANAPHSSPLSDVDHEAVIKFMIGLTLPTVAPAAHNVHSNLCVSVMSALERDAELAEPLLCRALALLSPPRTADLCRDLLHSTELFIKTIADKISYRNMSRFQAVLSMKIDSLEQRPSINTGLETLPEMNEDSLTSENTDRTSGKRKSVETADEYKSNTNLDDAEAESNDKSPSSSPPRKMKAITASEVAKRALRGSAMKSRTPRTTRSTVSFTPQSEAKVQETPPNRMSRETKSASAAKKPKSVRALGKQLEDVAPKNPKKTAAPKTPGKRGKGKKAVKDATVLNQSSSSNSSVEIDNFSDDETVLFTICHDRTETMSVLQDSSDDEKKSNTPAKSRPDITIPQSPESSDEISSSDEDIVIVKKPSKKNGNKK